MKKRFVKDTTRECSLIGIAAWDVGENIELRKWMSFEPVNYCFVNDNGLVTLYYEDKDYGDFYREICERLEENGFVERLSKDLDENIREGKRIMRKSKLSREEILELYQITIKCWPVTTMSYEATTSSEVVPSENVLRKATDLRSRYGEVLYELGNNIVEFVAELYPEIRGFENFVSIDEIRGERLPSIEELERRKRNYIYYSGVLESGKKFGDFLLEKGFEFIEKEIGEKIGGMTAMGGKVKGRVKMIFRVEDIEKVNEGDVLVASMTTPDHVVAMEKAAAFVTDEGGSNLSCRYRC